MIENHKEKIANDIIEYLKDSDTYEFYDLYENDESAIEYILNELETKNGVYDLIRDMTFEIECLSIEKDLNNKEVSNWFDRAFGIILSLNQYSLSLESKKEEKLIVN